MVGQFSRKYLKLTAGAEFVEEKQLADIPIYVGRCYQRDRKYFVMIHREPMRQLTGHFRCLFLGRTEDHSSERAAWKEAKELCT